MYTAVSFYLFFISSHNDESMHDEEHDVIILDDFLTMVPESIDFNT